MRSGGRRRIGFASAARCGHGEPGRPSLPGGGGGGGGGGLDSPPPPLPDAALRWWLGLSFSSAPFPFSPLLIFIFLFQGLSFLGGHRFDAAVHVYGCRSMEGEKTVG